MLIAFANRDLTLQSVTTQSDAIRSALPGVSMDAITSVVDLDDPGFAHDPAGSGQTSR